MWSNKPSKFILLVSCLRSLELYLFFVAFFLVCGSEMVMAYVSLAYVELCERECVCVLWSDLLGNIWSPGRFWSQEKQSIYNVRSRHALDSWDRKICCESIGESRLLLPLLCLVSIAYFVFLCLTFVDSYFLLSGLPEELNGFSCRQPKKRR